jgi:hypothetical protein
VGHFIEFYTLSQAFWKKEEDDPVSYPPPLPNPSFSSFQQHLAHPNILAFFVPTSTIIFPTKTESIKHSFIKELTLLQLN